METTGALGKAARNFLVDTCLLISIADEFNTPFKVKDYILRSLAIELQRGNLLVVQQGSQLANNAALHARQPLLGTPAYRLITGALPRNRPSLASARTPRLAIPSLIRSSSSSSSSS